MPRINQNFVRIVPPTPTPIPKTLPRNQFGLINNPFTTSIKWGNAEKSKSRKSKSRSRSPRRRKPSPRRKSRSRSPKRRQRRSRDRSRSRSNEKPRARQPRDARDKINSRHREDRTRAERTISNMNKIKGLEQIVCHKDTEISELKETIKSKEFKYQEMKKRALYFKQRCRAVSAAPQQFPMQYYQPQPFPPMMQVGYNSGVTRSVSNETVAMPDS